MPRDQSHKFSIRLLIDEAWREPLSDISRAKMVSRLALLRRYINAGMTEDLEHIREEIARIKALEGTKRELHQRVEQHQISRRSANDPIEF
jgi:hypothetical protein